MTLGTAGLTATLHTSFSDAVEQTTQALAEQGFGVLTRIDVKATLKQKLGKDMEDYLILGACNPQLAHRALDVDRQIGQLLPCNVVVRTAEDGRVLVEAMDPQLMVRVVDQPGLQEVADEAAAKLQAAIGALSKA
ncbi:MAG: ABC transporter [Mycobacterium sp.]|nr:MAG: ABC transporter [Mycobacterium sp.]